jgi:hypothetical protein
MKKKIILLIFLNCFSYSFAQSDEFSQESIKKTYSIIDSIYPASLTKHFPKVKNEYLLDLDLTYPGASNINNAYAVVLFDKEHFRIIENEARSNSIRQYHFVDSCLRIIKYNSRLYERAPFVLKQSHDTSNLLPIPNFDILAKSRLSSDLFKTATIYLLGAEEGLFLPSSKLNKENGLIDEWKHGYSRGIVIFKNNLALFWLEIW